MAQQTSTGNNNSRDDPSASTTSTDSLLSTNTTTSTINPLARVGGRDNPPPKDYAAALSVLQSRYGAGGHAIPSPKTKPSEKLQDSKPTTLVNTMIPGDNSQLTLVSEASISSSNATASTSTSAPSSSSSTTQSADKKKKSGGIRSLFKGKGKEKKQ